MTEARELRLPVCIFSLKCELAVSPWCVLLCDVRRRLSGGPRGAEAWTSVRS